jgi:hypothetical protein
MVLARGHSLNAPRISSEAQNTVSQLDGLTLDKVVTSQVNDDNAPQPA